MVRIQLVTTPMWSQDHLVRALAQVGFVGAESHADRVPLSSWRGIPLGADANVVVRREQIGAAGDDLGFVRNSRGTFDAMISEIHLFRFDRRWLEDLARRHDELARADGRTPPAQLPDWEKRDLGSVPTPVAAQQSSPNPAHSDVVAQQQASRARAQAAEVLDGLRKQQRKSGGLGCLLSLFLPIVLWVVLAATSPDLRSPMGFFLIALPLWIASTIVRAVRTGRRVKRAAQRLVHNLPSSSHAKDAAIAYLETRVKPTGAKTEDTVVKDLLKALQEPGA